MTNREASLPPCTCGGYRAAFDTWHHGTCAITKHMAKLAKEIRK